MFCMTWARSPMATPVARDASTWNCLASGEFPFKCSRLLTMESGDRLVALQPLQPCLESLDFTFFEVDFVQQTLRFLACRINGLLGSKTVQVTSTSQQLCFKGRPILCSVGRCTLVGSWLRRGGRVDVNRRMIANGRTGGIGH